MINYSMPEQLKDIFPSVSLAVIIGFVSWQLDLFLHKTWAFDDLSRIIVGGLIYFASYLGISVCIKMSPAVDFRKLVFKH
jgi:hypothetical protein